MIIALAYYPARFSGERKMLAPLPNCYLHKRVFAGRCGANQRSEAGERHGL